MAFVTEAVFREDAYLDETEAKVAHVNERGGIILDRTVFYATSGGQPGDTGLLVGPKAVRTACCRISDRPQVASSVSSGRL